MRKSKTCVESICESRKIAMPDEINPHGTLFGGVMMSWIDKIGYMCAQNYAGWKKTVTANIDQIQFVSPVHSGDHVTLKAVVVHVGRSSMEIEVISFKENPVDRSKKLVAKAFMTFVAINENGKGKMVPQLVLETDEDRLSNSNAKIRIEMRKKLIENLEINKTQKHEIKELPIRPFSSLWEILNSSKKLNYFAFNRLSFRLRPTIGRREKHWF